MINRLSERVLMWIAWHLPRKVVYWCSIRLMANETQGPYSSQIVPELKAMDALERWSTDVINGTTDSTASHSLTS